MASMLIALLVLGGTAGLVTLLVRHELKIREDRERVARKLGLQYNKGGWTSGPTLAGTIDGHEIEVQFIAGSKNSPSRTAYRVRGAPLIELKGGAAERLLGAIGFGDVRIGDDRFDKNYRLHGDQRELLAALPSNVRTALSALNWPKIDCGELQVTDNEHDAGDVLENKIRALVSLTKSMVFDPRRIDERLLEVFSVETELGVKLALIEHLIQSTVHEIRRRAIELALRDREAELRLIGAIHVGDPAVEVARKIALTEGENEKTRAKALLHLVQHRQLGEQDAERLALSMFAGADEDAKALLARGLERYGSIAAVEKLMEASQGLFKADALKEAARRAIAAIQARAGDGAERGSLALAEGESKEGALSQAIADGSLSIKD